DDALVLSDPERVDENFGDLPFLLAWANYPVYGARSYIAFDLSSIPAGEDVTFARLNLFQFAGGGYSSGVDLYHVTDDGWSEGTITWTNQPVLQPSIQEIIAQDPLLTGREPGWVSFDLLVNGVWDPSVDVAASDGRLSLIVRTSAGEVGTQRAHNFCSKEGGSEDCLLLDESGPVFGRAPQLVIGTPEPEFFGQLCAGATVLALARRSGRWWERRSTVTGRGGG
ncbi:MAG: DNRLRE domain-containing protein, partial [Myxococcales bacterium]|nr:DNRLRE domain-containing protein [Myxococcales bacterium]